MNEQERARTIEAKRERLGWLEVQVNEIVESEETDDDGEGYIGWLDDQRELIDLGSEVQQTRLELGRLLRGQDAE